MELTQIKHLNRAANQKRVKQQYFFAILLVAYIFIIFAVVIVFKIGYRLAEKEMKSVAMPSRQISSSGKNSKDQKKFKVRPIPRRDSMIYSQKNWEVLTRQNKTDNKSFPI